MTARYDIEATIGKLLPKFNTEYDIFSGYTHGVRKLRNRM